MTKESDIVDAAARLFPRKGFGGTSMDAIAREAGVAKQTVYTHFQSKDALFRKIVERRCGELFDTLPGGGKEAAGLESFLTLLGERVMAMLFQSDTLGLYRVVISESERFPELGRVYYEAGPRAAVEALAAVFERHGVARDECGPLSEQFFGMLTGHYLTRALLDPTLRPDGNARASAARRTAHTFDALVRARLANA